MRHIAFTKSVAGVEGDRIREQRELEKLSTQLDRNRLGQFATPPALALDILRLARRHMRGACQVSFIDPAVGTGAFFSALLQAFPEDAVGRASGFEIDDALARVAKHLWRGFGLHVRTEDFLRAPPPKESSRQSTLLVCNPPYSRHHHLSSETKTYARRRVGQSLGISVNGLASLYCYFILLSDSWLADGGLAVWLVPTEWMDVNYGQVLREYLTTRVTLRRLHRFDSEDLQFPDALVSSCVLVYQKRKPTRGHRVKVSQGSKLNRPALQSMVPLAVLANARKWGLLTQGRQGVPHTKTAESALTVGELFHIRRGLATGANRFFMLDCDAAKSHGLPDRFLLPILPSPRHLDGSEIKADKQGWPLVTPRLVLVNCDMPRDAVREFWPSLDRYLAQGEESGLTSRYLLRQRAPWYKQEVRPPAPILCSYMGRRKTTSRTFRFFRNYSVATAANVYLMLYPRSHLAHAERLQPGILDQVFEHLRALSSEQCLQEGRLYGGGLGKLEPRELARVGMPSDVSGLLALLGEGQRIPTLFD